MGKTEIVIPTEAQASPEHLSLWLRMTRISVMGLPTLRFLAVVGLALF